MSVTRSKFCNWSSSRHPFTNILLLRRQWLVYVTGAAKQEIKHPVNVCYSRCFINCEYVVARDPNRWQRLQVLPGHHSHQIDTIAQKSHVIRPGARGLPWKPTCPRRRNFRLTGGGWLDGWWLPAGWQRRLCVYNMPRKRHCLLLFPAAAAPDAAINSFIARRTVRSAVSAISFGVRLSLRPRHTGRHDGRRQCRLLCAGILWKRLDGSSTGFSTVSALATIVTRLWYLQNNGGLSASETSCQTENCLDFLNYFFHLPDKRCQTEFDHRKSVTRSSRFR